MRPLELIVQRVAGEAGDLAFLLFGIGLLIIAVRAAQAVVARRQLRAFTSSCKDKELVALLDTPGWPSLLVDARDAFRRMQGRPGAAFDLEAAQRGISSEISQHGAWVKPIASTLIIVALLATFQGMRRATADLAASVQKIESVPRAGAPDAAGDGNFGEFREKVNDALTSMTAAFGANLHAIFFAAVLALLLPALRLTQRQLLSEVRRFMELVVRPAISGEQIWVNDLVRALGRHGEEGNKHLEAQLRSHNDKLVDAMAAMTSRTGDLVQALQPALEGALSAVKEQLVEEQGRRVDEYASAVRAVAKQYEAVVTLFAAHGARIDATVAEIRRGNLVVGEKLEVLQRTHDAAIHSFTEAQTAASTVLVDSKNTLAEVSDRFALGLLERLTEWREGTAAELSSLRREIGAAGEKVAHLSESQSQSLGGLEEAQRALGFAAEKFASAALTASERHQRQLDALQELLPRRGAASPDAAAMLQGASGDASGERFRELYNEFLRAAQSAGKKAEGFEEFSRRVASIEKSVMAAHQCEAVRLEVVVINGAPTVHGSPAGGV